MSGGWGKHDTEIKKLACQLDLNQWLRKQALNPQPLSLASLQALSRGTPARLAGAEFELGA